jgi:uncharacterized protein YbaP (TraB family)
MNNKTINIFLLFLIIIISSCKSIKINDPADTGKLANSLFWKIEGNGLSKPSYLFGTIHIIKSEDFFLPQNFDKAFKDAKNIVFEIDMSEIDEMEEMSDLLPKIVMQDEIGLKDLLNEEEYKKIDEYFKNAGLPLFFFEKVKPMFLTLFADPEIKPDVLQSGEYKSYEMEFNKKANEAGKKVMGLESIDYQISVIDSIPYEEQAKMLLHSIEKSSQDSSINIKLYKDYKEQRINDLLDYVVDAELTKYENILLKNRNSNWIPIMEKIMKEDCSIFAVGAAHLAGEIGVINLLKTKGFKLIPLSTTK